MLHVISLRLYQVHIYNDCFLYSFASTGSILFSWMHNMDNNHLSSFKEY